MSRFVKLGAIIGLIIFAASVCAEILVYEFKDPALEARFNQLTQELRCPKCQNNNIADSNAPLSVDLKDIIYEKLHEGNTDKQIVGFLVERYGDFITYRPPLKPSTWLIWFGPFVVLLIGAFSIFKFVSSRQAPTRGLESDLKPSKKDPSGAALVNQWKEEIDGSNGDIGSSANDASNAKRDNEDKSN